MELNDYQQQAMKTCTPSSRNFAYMALNLTAEVGEAMGKVAKAIRKEGAIIRNNHLEDLSEHQRIELAYELGDVLWQLAGLSRVCGFDLEFIATQNLIKLADRQQRGTIVGGGDHR